MIIFRKLTGDAPAHWSSGEHWLVEYDPAEFYFPLGTAYVRATNGTCHLDAILVAEGYGAGPIKSALYTACLERWPGLVIPDRPRIPPHRTHDSSSQFL